MKRQGEAGYSLVALMATITIMTVLMAAAVPSWRYVVQHDREEELIFRGCQIARAIPRFQQKNGNALPPSIEALVKGKFLRKPYTDPMVKSGKWRFLRQGEGQGLPVPGRGLPSPSPSPSPSPGSGGTTFGVFQGVASTSTDEGYRIFNGKSHYNDWQFNPQVCEQFLYGGVPSPGSSPSPSPSPRR